MTVERNTSYDVVVLGAGPAGMAAALYAASHSLSVALVNGGSLLGYGLHGAYKSKGLYELAQHWVVASRVGRGAVPSGQPVQFHELHDQLQSGAAALTELYLRYLGQMNVHTLSGFGRFVDPHTVEVNGQRLHARYFVIATGSRPRVLPGVAVDGHYIMTSDQIVDIAEGFDSVTVIGAGVIGCEFASILAALGVHVTLLDTADRLLSHEDPDLSAFLTHIYRRNGIEVRFGARSSAVEVVAGQVKTELETGSVIVSHRALLSVGRVPYVDALDLPAAGVETGRGGIILVNDRLQTSVPHIYAVGDVSQRMALLNQSLVHVAEAEGRLAVRHILGQPITTDPSYIPFIIFTMPMIAGAGLTEAQARQQYGPVRVAKFLNARNHRYHAMRSFEGYLKLIVAPPGDDRILGIRAVGPHADSVIGEAAVLIDHEIPYTYLVDCIHAHPSLAESLQNAARIIAGTFPATIYGDQPDG